MLNLFDDGQELLPQNEGVEPKFIKNIPLPEDDDLLEEEIPPDPGDIVLPGGKPQRWHSAPDLPSFSEVFPKHQKKRS